MIEYKDKLGLKKTETLNAITFAQNKFDFLLSFDEASKKGFVSYRDASGTLTKNFPL